MGLTGTAEKVVPNKKGALLYMQNCGQTQESKFFKRNNPAYLLAVNLNYLPKLISVASKVKGWGSLTADVIFSVVMGLALVLAIVALAIALIARVIILWIMIPLSPLIALFYLLPQAKDEKLDVWQTFLNEAFLPAKVAFALTVGFLMIKSMIPEDVFEDGLKFNFGAINSLDGLQGAGDLQHLLFLVMAMVTMWIGVFSALEKSVVNDTLQKFKGFGETAVKWTGERLKYMPIIPTKDGEGISLGAITKMPNIMSSAEQYRADKMARHQLRKMEIDIDGTGRLNPTTESDLRIKAKAASGALSSYFAGAGNETALRKFMADNKVDLTNRGQVEQAIQIMRKEAKLGDMKSGELDNLVSRVLESKGDKAKATTPVSVVISRGLPTEQQAEGLGIDATKNQEMRDVTIDGQQVTFIKTKKGFELSAPEKEELIAALTAVSKKSGVTANDFKNVYNSAMQGVGPDLKQKVGNEVNRKIDIQGLKIENGEVKIKGARGAKGKEGQEMVFS